MPPSVDTSIGQRAMSAVVDIAFFVVVGVLGFTRVLSEPLLGALLGSYASARFGIAYGKQQTVVALASQQERRATGASGDQYPAQRPPSDRPPYDPPPPPAPPRRALDPRADPPTRTDRPFDRGDRLRRSPLPMPSTSPLVQVFRNLF